ncbi:MAG: DUF2934 domain-containing protein [bacterium]|nr:DUF2934 domain-containing protein [bacterium]
MSRKAKTTPSRTASTVAPAAPTQPRQPVENSVLAASPQTAPTRRTVSADERRELIAERAYDKARQRGFRNGTPQGDWLAAEAEVDALLRRDAEA